MKILTIHADYLEYEPKKKAIKEAEEVTKKKYGVDECLVVFIAVERSDKDIKNTSLRLSQEIKDIAKQVKTKKIVLYPYAHLSSNLGSAENALEILKETEKILKKNYKVIRPPFGWYKSFTIACKGHPLSELSREFSVEEAKPTKERKKGAEFVKFMIVDKDGKSYDVTRQNWKNSKILSKKGKEYERLKIFVRNELEGHRSEAPQPKHIEYMQKLELVNYCAESDSGNFKWYPKGLLIKELILMYQERLARKYGAFKIANPLIYRLSVPYIKKLLGEFHERDYSWKEDRDELILRFASDPGVFSFMQKTNFSYKILPIREYEEAICFRKEQRGELKGLRRVRNFLMTDVHAFCKDHEQTKEEFEKLCFICRDLMSSIIASKNWVLGWEGTLNFYNENKKWLSDLVKKLQIPSFFKLMKERSHYYEMKNEFQSIEADGENTQVSTVQYDDINGKRFNISYVDKDGKKKPCIIIHCSTFGSIERTLCAILENAAINELEGKLPLLPLWLSPTQVRLVPVSVDKHLKFCEKLADEIEKEDLRVDIDDSSETVNKKVMNSAEGWVPFTVVIGDKEKKGSLPVRIRDKKDNVLKMTKKQLIGLIKKDMKDLPFKPLPLPRLVSKRVRFVG